MMMMVIIMMSDVVLLYVMPLPTQLSICRKQYILSPTSMMLYRRGENGLICFFSNRDMVVGCFFCFC